MSHTNSTTNYSLPQFITTDKPAWLTDVNNAYAAIDTGMHNAQIKADSAQADATQALSDASDAATAAAAADAKGAGAIASIADAFDSSTIYNVGAIVIYNNLLYRCTVAIITPGPWTGSANWERVNIEDIIPASAANLPYDSTMSTKQAIDQFNLGTEVKSATLNISAGNRMTITLFTDDEKDNGIRFDIYGGNEILRLAKKENGGAWTNVNSLTFPSI